MSNSLVGAASLLNVIKCFFGSAKSAAVASTLMGITEFRAFLERERFKSDRGGAQFSLVVIPARKADKVLEGDIAAFFARHLRITDLIGWMDNSRVGIYLFDAGKQGAQAFIERLSAAPDVPLSLDVAKVYSYPDEASEIFSASKSKRSEERLDIEISAFITYRSPEGNASSIALSTKNLSAGGAFFVADEALDLGQIVDIDLVLPLEHLRNLGGKSVLIKASGKVVRKDPEGIAVAFADNRMVTSSAELTGADEASGAVS